MGGGGRPYTVCVSQRYSNGPHSTIQCLSYCRRKVQTSYMLADFPFYQWRIQDVGNGA